MLAHQSKYAGTLRAVSVWNRVKNWLGDRDGAGYQSEASLDLDVLDVHEAASRLLVAVDLSRLARRNKERRAAPHFAVGDLHVEDGSLRWTPHRLERGCGVPIVQFGPEELRTIDRRSGAIVAVLRDGTNIPFIVNTAGVTTKPGRRLLRPKTSGQEPPIIS